MRWLESFSVKAKVGMVGTCSCTLFDECKERTKKRENSFKIMKSWNNKKRVQDEVLSLIQSFLFFVFPVVMCL